MRANSVCWPIGCGRVWIRPTRGLACIMLTSFTSASPLITLSASNTTM
jgi:hypothetical protein